MLSSEHLQAALDENQPRELVMFKRRCSILEVFMSVTSLSLVTARVVLYAYTMVWKLRRISLTRLCLPDTVLNPNQTKKIIVEKLNFSWVLTYKITTVDECLQHITGLHCQYSLMVRVFPRECAIKPFHRAVVCICTEPYHRAPYPLPWRF